MIVSLYDKIIHQFLEFFIQQLGADTGGRIFRKSGRINVLN